MVGSRTVVNDDPELSVRLVAGRSPLRVILDREGRSPLGSKVFDGKIPTLLFTEHERPALKEVEQVRVDSFDPLDEVLAELHQRNIRSVIVEGGAILLNAFLEKGLWDEARVITGQAYFRSGTLAPAGLPDPIRTLDLDGDRLDLHVNTENISIPREAWCW